MMTASRVRLLLAALLVVSGIAFAVGSAAERSSTVKSSPPSSESSSTHAEGEGAETSGGETAGTKPAQHTETTAESETLLGINPESTALVVVGVALSLLLAAGVWFWGYRPLLIAVLVFGVAFAALDIREVIHQADESRTALVVVAIVLTVMHSAVAALAALAVRTPEVTPARV